MMPPVSLPLIPKMLQVSPLMASAGTALSESANAAISSFERIGGAPFGSSDSRHCRSGAARVKAARATVGANLSGKEGVRRAAGAVALDRRQGFIDLSRCKAEPECLRQDFTIFGSILQKPPLDLARHVAR